MTPRESFQKLDDLLSFSINRQNDKLSKVLADAVSKARKIRLNYKTTMQGKSLYKGLLNPTCI